MKSILIALSISIICLLCAGGCQTAYFGVEDEALLAPADFSETQQFIERAKKHADSLYAEKKVDKAMELGKTASITYWECRDEEAKDLLALAREAALSSELYQPQPLPPASKRAESIPRILESPVKLHAGVPFTGFKAIPPRMTLNTVYFDFNSTRITPPYRSQLDRQLPIMKESSDIMFEIAGHTDSLGPDRYNYYLSRQRANSVAAYLESQGISREQLSPVGYGENEPIATNATEAGRARNRRAENRLAEPLLPEEQLKDLDDIPAGTAIEVINFNFGQDTLLPVYSQLLDNIVAALKSNPSVNLEIIGYTDTMGTPEANQNLAEDRANQVKNYLVQNGIAQGRLSIKASGETDPIASNTSSRGRGFNRRAELRTAPALQTESTTGPSGDDQIQYAIQIASFKHPANAETVRKTFADQGYPVYHQKAEINGVTWHRVRLGPYFDKEEARETLQKLKSRGLASESYLVKEQ